MVRTGLFAPSLVDGTREPENFVHVLLARSDEIGQDSKPRVVKALPSSINPVVLSTVSLLNSWMEEGTPFEPLFF